MEFISISFYFALTRKAVFIQRKHATNFGTNPSIKQVNKAKHDNIRHKNQYLVSVMIRSARIPSVLRRICTDNIIQTALLVTTDGELLGSTATTFLSPDGTTKESIESLGTLIADIAVDYGKLGEEYANLDLGGIPLKTIHTTSGHTTDNSSNSQTSQSPASTEQQQQQQSNKKSHLQCLFLELELGLVAVSACVGVDCMVIAIAAPSAPLGTVKARLQAITAHVQEALRSPLAMTEASRSTYR